jgi:tetratricopeptide (TPR) repeat protein
MNRLFPLFLVCGSLFVASSGAAQSSVIDSLLVVLQNIPTDNDTAHLHHRAQVTHRLSSNYSVQKDYEKARVFARESLRLSTQTNRLRGIAQGLNNIAFAYQFEARYPEAVDTFLRAYAVWEQLRDTGKMANTATNISNIYYEIPGQSAKELEYALRCVHLTEQARRWHGLCACTHLVGDIFDRMGKPDSAAYYLQRSLYLLEKTPDLPGLATLYLSMARAESRKKQHKKALDWLLKAMATQQQYPNGITDIEKTNTLLSLGDTYLALQQPTKAAPYLRQVEQSLIGNIPDLTYHDRLYEHLSRLAMQQNNPVAALEYFKRHIAARDSLLNAANTRRMTEVEMRHEFEKKQSVENAAQQRALDLRDARNAQQKFVFGFVLLALAAAAGFGFYMYRQRQERRRTELELANLRAQINPHFIFNCLNSIYRYTKERDTETAARYLQKFSSLLRLVLENSRAEKITLARDLEALQLYIDIEALRFKEKLHFVLEMDPDIDPSFIQIPGMLVQPHVENAIWHGLMHRPEGGKLYVRLAQPSENLLRVEVEDNGIGRAAAAELESKSAVNKKSLGQMITAERLKSTGKLASLNIFDLTDASGQPCGTKVVMDIVL